MMRFILVLALAASACAQPTKPSVLPDPGASRADSVIERSPRPSSGETADGTPAEATRPTVVTERAVALGETRVTIRVSERLGPDAAQGAVGLDALNLHDNEGTSVEAVLDVVGTRGGRVVELVHSGERNLSFRLSGDVFIADPNRIFTDAGRRRTLAALSRDVPAARAALEAFADTVLAVYTERRVGVVVTLHNNTPDNYSAASYAQGGEYARDAEAVTIHPGSDPDDFFFVTERALYDALARQGFNAVLQDNARATDDGSLSVWAAQRGIPYVNVEAEHGHRIQQAGMIDALAQVLGTRR